MPTAIIRYKVRDYDSWFRSFIAREGAMRQMGIQGINVRQTLDDPNDVVLTFRFTDVERFRSIMRDPQTRALMESDGVVSAADVIFCTDPIGRPPQQGGRPGGAGRRQAVAGGRPAPRR
jgi:hypothetical protein